MPTCSSNVHVKELYKNLQPLTWYANSVSFTSIVSVCWWIRLPSRKSVPVASWKKEATFLWRSIRRPMLKGGAVTWSSRSYRCFWVKYKFRNWNHRKWVAKVHHKSSTSCDSWRSHVRTDRISQKEILKRGTAGGSSTTSPFPANTSRKCSQTTSSRLD